MTLPEAIVYLLASSKHGMKTEVIARLINEKGLCQRWDGKPVDGKQVYAVIMAHLDTNANHIEYPDYFSNIAYFVEI